MHALFLHVTACANRSLSGITWKLPEQASDTERQRMSAEPWILQQMIPLQQTKQSKQEAPNKDAASPNEHRQRVNTASKLDACSATATIASLSATTVACCRVCAGPLLHWYSSQLCASFSSVTMSASRLSFFCSLWHRTTESGPRINAG